MIDTDGIVFVLYSKFGNLIIDESNPNYIEPEFSLEVSIREVNEEIVFSPTVSTNIFNNGTGIIGINWDLQGNTGYPIKKSDITIIS